MDLVLTEFTNVSLYDVMKLMQSTDLFLGMHGAGFTNALFLPPVRLYTIKLVTAPALTALSAVSSPPSG